jgi:hypothetical protein
MGYRDARPMTYPSVAILAAWDVLLRAVQVPFILKFIESASTSVVLRGRCRLRRAAKDQLLGVNWRAFAASTSRLPAPPSPVAFFLSYDPLVGVPFNGRALESSSCAAASRPPKVSLLST